MKTRYISPEIEVLKLFPEAGLLQEHSWQVGNNPSIPIKDGDPTDPGVHFSKSHDVWEDGGVQDAPEDWGDSWEE